jgi:hypothetical protein
MDLVPNYRSNWEQCMWLHLLWAAEGGELR